MSEESKIEIKIQSTYDGTGAKQANKSVTSLGNTTAASAQKTSTGLKKITEFAEKTRKAIEGIRYGLGWIGILYTAYEAIKRLCTTLTAKAQSVITAGQNIATAWKAATEAAALKEKDTTAEASLQRQLALHQQILAAKRETASFEAQIRETEARTNGNIRETRRAVLDGRLARGEITQTDHLRATRQLEDEETQERHTAEQAAQNATLAEKETALALAREKGNRALQRQTETEQNLINAGVLKQDHTFNDYDAASGGLVRLAEMYAETIERLETMEKEGRGYTSPQRYEQNKNAEKALAEKYFAQIARAAEALNISPHTTTTNEQGKTTETKRNPTSILNEIREKTTATLKTLNDNIQTSAREIAEAKQNLERQREIAEHSKRARETETQALATRRAEEDKTTLHTETENTRQTAETLRAENELAAATARQTETAEAEQKAAGNLQAATENLRQYLEGSGKITLTDPLEKLTHSPNQTIAATAEQAKRQLDTTLTHPENTANTENLTASLASLNLQYDTQTLQYLLTAGKALAEARQAHSLATENTASITARQTAENTLAANLTQQKTIAAYGTTIASTYANNPNQTIRAAANQITSATADNQIDPAELTRLQKAAETLAAQKQNTTAQRLATLLTTLTEAVQTAQQQQQRLENEIARQQTRINQIARAK